MKRVRFYIPIILVVVLVGIMGISCEESSITSQTTPAEQPAPTESKKSTFTTEPILSEIPEYGPDMATGPWRKDDLQ